MYKRHRDSGGGDNESFDPIAFYRQAGGMRSLELSKSKMRSQAELMTGFSRMKNLILITLGYESRTNCKQ